MKYSRKQIVFTALNPPAWVYLLAKYAIIPSAKAIGKSVLFILMVVVATVMWDYLNKTTKKYVPWGRCWRKVEGEAYDIAFIAAMVACIASVLLVPVLLAIPSWIS